MKEGGEGGQIDGADLGAKGGDTRGGMVSDSDIWESQKLGGGGGDRIQGRIRQRGGTRGVGVSGCRGVRCRGRFRSA
eukprot:1181146-Prorocentrum_minimum.AAC.2